MCVKYRITGGWLQLELLLWHSWHKRCKGRLYFGSQLQRLLSMMVKWNSSCSGREPPICGMVLSISWQPSLLLSANILRHNQRYLRCVHYLMGFLVPSWWQDWHSPCRCLLAYPVFSTLWLLPYFLSSAVYGQLDYVFWFRYYYNLIPWNIYLLILRGSLFAGLPVLQTRLASNLETHLCLPSKCWDKRCAYATLISLEFVNISEVLAYVKSGP